MNQKLLAKFTCHAETFRFTRHGSIDVNRDVVESEAFYPVAMKSQTQLNKKLIVQFQQFLSK